MCRILRSTESMSCRRHYVPNHYSGIKALSTAPFGAKNCCKIEMMKPRISGCTCAEWRRALTAFTDTRTPVQQSSLFTPCSLFQVCHCAKTVLTVEEAEKRVAWQSLTCQLSGRTLGSPAPLWNKSQILGDSNACSQHWHLAAECSCQVCQGDLHGQ